MSLIGFSGPRRLLPGQGRLVSAVVDSVLRAGRGVGVGCASGVDAWVIVSALSGGAASSLSVFSAFGPEGQGAGRSSSLLGVLLAQRAGASVQWFAGGESPPLPARLARRSQALVSSVSVSGLGCGFVGFASRPCPAGVIPSRSWQSCGSGTWSTLLLAAGKGVPVVVFPLGLALAAAGLARAVGAGGAGVAVVGRLALGAGSRCAGAGAAVGSAGAGGAGAPAASGAGAAGEAAGGAGGAGAAGRAKGEVGGVRGVRMNELLRRLRRWVLCSYNGA